LECSLSSGSYQSDLDLFQFLQCRFHSASELPLLKTFLQDLSWLTNRVNAFTCNLTSSFAPFLSHWRFSRWVFLVSLKVFNSWAELCSKSKLADCSATKTSQTCESSFFGNLYSELGLRRDINFSSLDFWASHSVSFYSKDR